MKKPYVLILLLLSFGSMADDLPNPCERFGKERVTCLDVIEGLDEKLIIVEPRFDVGGMKRFVLTWEKPRVDNDGFCHFLGLENVPSPYQGDPNYEQNQYTGETEQTSITNSLSPSEKLRGGVVFEYGRVSEFVSKLRDGYHLRIITKTCR